jgi:hypothetical protein
VISQYFISKLTDLHRDTDLALLVFLDSLLAAKKEIWLKMGNTQPESTCLGRKNINILVHDRRVAAFRPALAQLVPDCHIAITASLANQEILQVSIADVECAESSSVVLYNLDGAGCWIPTPEIS